MKFRLSCVAGMLAASIGMASGQAQEFVPGEVLVKFTATGSQARAVAAGALLGASVKREIGGIGVALVQLPPGVSVQQAVSFYSGMSGVVFAEPNGIMQAMFVPDDPLFGTDQWGPQKIKCPEAWDLNTGDSSVIIAIIDTGVDYNHPDLTGKTVAGWDFVNGDNDPMDDQGHGTHCAGIAAANTNNAVGMAGVGYNCSIMPVKVLDAGGFGSWADIASGIDFASTNGAHVLNLSLGGGGGSAALELAVNNAWANNRLVVVAAGNSNTTAPSYPAFYTNSLAVASTTSTDARSSFSNYGNWVDVAAPGSDIISTRFGGYEYLNGTSMACPHVAGLGGLLFAQLGANTPVSTIRQRIENNCDPVGNFVLKGRVNAFKALTGGGGVVPKITTLTATPRVIRPGQRSRILITLDQAAPAGGTVVTITKNSNAVLIPSSIRIPAGRRSFEVIAIGSPTSDTRRVDLTFKIGRNSKMVSILVQP
ncbi:MAG TPA: S8 family peptidase [Fimbriimonadaceae bacterium]|nr:S8 family peptidase [Fimbriimonadaceae bacterium]HRJ97751.1 S8 family peptidase [Fimbriimonadaceae bacterium]